MAKDIADRSTSAFVTYAERQFSRDGKSRNGDSCSAHGKQLESCPSSSDTVANSKQRDHCAMFVNLLQMQS